MTATRDVCRNENTIDVGIELARCKQGGKSARILTDKMFLKYQTVRQSRRILGAFISKAKKEIRIRESGCLIVETHIVSQSVDLSKSASIIQQRQSTKQ